MKVKLSRYNRKRQRRNSGRDELVPVTILRQHGPPLHRKLVYVPLPRSTRTVVFFERTEGDHRTDRAFEHSVIDSCQSQYPWLKTFHLGCTHGNDVAKRRIAKIYLAILDRRDLKTIGEEVTHTLSKSPSITDLSAVDVQMYISEKDSLHSQVLRELNHSDVGAKDEHGGDVPAHLPILSLNDCVTTRGRFSPFPERMCHG